MKYVPKIGLENLGQTCYMNSVLQCFSNLYHITNYFLNPQKQELIKNHMNLTNRKEDSLLCFAFKELIDNLWKGVPNQPFSPKKFKKRLEKLNPLFAANTAGDSKDFVNYLIIELHEELNLIETNPVAGSIQNMENINPLNQEEVFKAFMSKFAIENYSIISNNFYGVTQGQFECQRCKMKLLNKGIPSSPIKYNYENFFYLEFPLDEVRKYIAEQNNSFQYYQNITEVTIFDCFNYHTKLNSIIGYCDKCKVDNAQINSRNTIFSPSKILMLIFNRGKGIQYKIKINFPFQLNISNIVTNSMNQYYDLQGVVKHFGESNSYGHFMAYCRPPVPMYHDQWYCFNDQTVVEVNDMNDIVEKGDTYILFYELKNIKQ
jgi:ubiquitin C-terminal hydrolase